MFFSFHTHHEVEYVEIGCISKICAVISIYPLEAPFSRMYYLSPIIMHCAGGPCKDEQQILICCLYRVKKSWVKERYHALFFADNRQYGDYLWPEAALKGNLTQLDKESAKTVYSQLKGNLL